MAESIEIILLLLGQFGNCFSRTASYKYFVGFVLAYLIAGRRMTVTGVYRFLGSDDNLSNYHRFLSRSPWKPLCVSRTLFSIILATVFKMQTAQDRQKLILVVDSTVIGKAGKKTDGIGKHYCSMTSRTENGHEVVRLSILLNIIGMGIIEIPFLCALYVTEKAIAARSLDLEYCTREEMAANMVGIVREWTELPILLIADALYSKETTVNALSEVPDACLISRRLNGKTNGGVAWEKFSSPEQVKRGKGRPRTKGKEIRFNDIPLEQFTDCPVCSRGKTETVKAVKLEFMMLRHCKNPVTIVIMLGEKQERIVIISTDLTLSASVIIEFYRMRFSIEFGFRDTKQFTGLGDYQVRGLASIEKHLTLSQTAYSIGKLAFLLCEDLRQRSQQFFYLKTPKKPSTFPMMRLQEELRTDLLITLLTPKENHRPNLLKTIFNHHPISIGNKLKSLITTHYEENIAA